MNNNNKILILAMFYVTFKLTCNVLFFRQIAFTFPLFNYSIKFCCSSLLFPFIYITCDAIVAITNRNRVTILSIVIIGALCDGIYSNCVNLLHYFPIPNSMSQNELVYTNLINALGVRTWSLFYHGVIASFVAMLGEIYLFSKLFARFNKFLPSTFISITSVLLMHNIISDYPLLMNEPDGLRIVANGTIINLIILLIYISFLSLLSKLNYLAIPHSICYNYLYDKSCTLLQKLAKLSTNQYELKLSKHKLLIEDETLRPYFLVSNLLSLKVFKLYTEDWYLNQKDYEAKFSKKDTGIIQYYLGGLKASELNSMFSIQTINYENKTITVLNKKTLKVVVWNLFEIVRTQQYLMLDKTSLFQVACFYMENKKDIPDEKIYKIAEVEDSIPSTAISTLILVK